MTDVLKLAHARRAELTKELEKLDWFLKKAEELLSGAASTVPVVKAEAEVQTKQPSDALTSKSAVAPSQETKVLKVQTPPAGQAAVVEQRPVDTVVFQKMLSEMRRKHWEPAADATQKMAATG